MLARSAKHPEQKKHNQKIAFKVRKFHQPLAIRDICIMHIYYNTYTECDIKIMHKNDKLLWALHVHTYSTENLNFLNPLISKFVEISISVCSFTVHCAHTFKTDYQHDFVVFGPRKHIIFTKIAMSFRIHIYSQIPFVHKSTLCMYEHKYLFARKSQWYLFYK